MTDALVEIAAALFDLNPDDIDDALAQDDVSSWDSFTQIMLITQVEETFRVRLDPQELTRIKSIGDMRAMLRKRGVQV
jgi:acyl carrier protein